ncbi:MAG: homogentisate 1,2-dioxygenase [Planctomycetes bacterium]|nr:homogentisate 1,2-dioxygenase [Planctomycetota bacterium]
MPYYRQLGSIPRKRHIAHRTTPGFKGEGLFYEEVVTTQGFGRSYSIVYHLRPPTRVKRIEPAGSVKIDVVPQEVLRHIHVKTYQIEFDSAERDMLVIEAPGNVDFPKRYLNPDGQLRLGAPYSERDLHGPRETLIIDREEDTPILIKDGERFSRYVLAQHPFDVVGWDGQVYPFTFNADDFEPITGTIHQPPPIHQTFETNGFVVCTFAPRMLDTHPDAIKVPYSHSNVESDEVLYYVRGKFGSRRGIEEASFTLHPRGIPHGPHPGTIVASRDMKWTDELAVMVDTFRPLQITRKALEMDDPKYPMSWLE